MISVSSIRYSSGFSFYLGIIVVLAVLQVLANDLTPLLEYNRQRLIDGEFWRVVTGHLMHLSWYHWSVNVAGICLVLFVLPVRSYFLHEVSLVIMLAFGIGIGLFWLAPDLIYYVGISGILHGVFVTAIWRSPYYSLIVRLLVLALIVIKMIWEFSSLYDPFAQVSQLGGRVEVRAHLIGVVLGFLWLVIHNLIINDRSRNQTHN